MSLSDLASIGSLISGVAVLVSLIYLGLQVRQSERNQQAAIRQGRAMRVVDAYMRVTDASLAAAFSKGVSGSEDISHTQFVQFSHYCAARFNGAEDAFYQHLEGLLNDRAFGSFMNAMRQFLSSPGTRAVWKRHRGMFGSEFVAFVEKLMAETKTATAVDELAHWKTDVTAEKATGLHT